MMRNVTVCGLVLLFALSGGCRREYAEAAASVGPVKSSDWMEDDAVGESQSRERDSGPRLIVVYLIDTLRADRLGAYGSDRGLTPHLDALAAEAALFEHAYAPAPWTLPSVASIFTSTWVTEHGVTTLKRSLHPSMRTLAEILSDHGYLSAAFVSNANTEPVTRAGRGYEYARLRDKTFMPADIDEWLDRMGDSRTHLYVHTTEPHNPFMAPVRWIRRFGAVSEAQRRAVNDAMRTYRDLTKVDIAAGRTPGETDNSAEQDVAMARLRELLPALHVLYDAHVAWADRHVGAFISMLKRRGVWDDCLFILLSDHGEEFDDHGGWLHDQSVYEEIVRVPLMIRFPGGAHAGTRIETPVSLVDVMPTVLDTLGVDLHRTACRGGSLLPLIVREATDGGQPAVMAVRRNETKFYRPHKERRGDLNIAVREGPWKGILNVEKGDFELYNLQDDPQERRDAAGDHPALAARLAEIAAQWLEGQRRDQSVADDAALAPESVKNLKALGYLGH